MNWTGGIRKRAKRQSKKKARLAYFTRQRVAGAQFCQRVSSVQSIYSKVVLMHVRLPVDDYVDKACTRTCWL